MADEEGSNGVTTVNGLQGLLANVPGQAYPLVVASTGSPLPGQVLGQMGTTQNPQGVVE